MAGTPGDIVLEIDGSRNQDFYFLPLQRALRSKWIPRRSGPGYPRSLNDIEEIWGYEIRFNIKARKAVLHDKMLDDKELLQRVRVAADHFNQEVGEPLEDEEFHLSDQQVNEWLWWLRRGVDDGILHVTQGSLPSVDDIKSRGTQTGIRHPMAIGDDKFIVEPVEATA